MNYSIIEYVMIKNILKAAKSEKSKRFHMKSMLKQVRNKSQIEDIDFERKLSQVRINPIDIKLLKRRKTRGARLTDSVTTSKQNSTELQFPQNSSTGFPLLTEESEQQSNLSQLTVPKSVRSVSRFNRRSSRLEVQLDEIIKYSELYPSRKDSHQEIAHNIDQLLLRVKSRENSNSKGKSKFSQMYQASGQEQPVRLRAQRRLRHTDKSVVARKPDQSMLVKFVDEQQHEDEKLLAHNKNIELLIKKSKNAIKQHQQTFDYSLEHFIESELLELRKKNGRQTVGGLGMRDTKFTIDIRDQNINDLHKFIRGEPKDDEQYDKCMTTRQMEQFQAKYNIYKSIYKKTKENFAADKININEINNLTIRNAVYLNECMKQTNCRESRKDIHKSMKKLKLY